MGNLSENAIELNDKEVFNNCSYSCYMNISTALDELKTYENLEEQGMLLKLNAPIENILLCTLCTNPIKSDRGCDGNCKYDDELLSRILKAIDNGYSNV